LLANNMLDGGQVLLGKPSMRDDHDTDQTRIPKSVFA
jgi:hypothetical protein